MNLCCLRPTSTLPSYKAVWHRHWALSPQRTLRGLIPGNYGLLGALKIGQTPNISLSLSIHPSIHLPPTPATLLPPLYPPVQGSGVYLPLKEKRDKVTMGSSTAVIGGGTQASSFPGAESSGLRKQSGSRRKASFLSPSNNSAPMFLFKIHIFIKRVLLFFFLRHVSLKNFKHITIRQEQCNKPSCTHHLVVAGP